MERKSFGSSLKPLVSVITATIPGRERFLKECCYSVKSQTLRDVEHVVRTDRLGDGCSATTNRAVADAIGEWLFILNDDDLILPCCLEHLVANSEGADIVYPVPLVWGEEPGQFCGTPPAIPASALIRTQLWNDLNGYDGNLRATEDRDFYRRAQEYGAVFRRFDKAPTWIYRLGHGGNKSRLS